MILCSKNKIWILWRGDALPNIESFLQCFYAHFQRVLFQSVREERDKGV